MCIFFVGYNYIGIYIENMVEIGWEIELILRGVGWKVMCFLGF